jgi:hypothetical protein
MKAVERLATKAAKASNGLMTCQFITESSFVRPLA